MMKMIKKIIGTICVFGLLLVTLNGYSVNAYAANRCVHSYTRYTYYSTEQTGGYQHKILVGSYPAHPEWNEYAYCYVQCEELVYHYCCGKCGYVSSREYKRESVEEHTDSRCPQA